MGAGLPAQRAEGGYSRARNQGGRAEKTGWATGGALLGAEGLCRKHGGEGAFAALAALQPHNGSFFRGTDVFCGPSASGRPRDGGAGATAHSLQPPGPRQASWGSSIPTPGGLWAACPGCRGRGCTHSPKAHSQRWELAPRFLLGHLEPCCPRRPWRRPWGTGAAGGGSLCPQDPPRRASTLPPSCRPSISTASASSQCPLAAGHPSSHTPLSFETQLAMGPRQPSPGASYPTHPTCS